MLAFSFRFRLKESSVPNGFQFYLPDSGVFKISLNFNCKNCIFSLSIFFLNYEVISKKTKALRLKFAVIRNDFPPWSSLNTPLTKCYTSKCSSKLTAPYIFTKWGGLEPLWPPKYVSGYRCYRRRGALSVFHIKHRRRSQNNTSFVMILQRCGTF